MISTSIAGYAQGKLTFESDCDNTVNVNDPVYQKFTSVVSRAFSDPNNIPASGVIGICIQKINSNRCVIQKGGRIKVTGQPIGKKWLGLSGELVSSLSGLFVIKPLGYVDPTGFFYIELQDNAVVKRY